MDIRPTLRFNPHFESLPVYNAGMSLNEARKVAGGTELARLASNENPYRCSPKALDALQQGMLTPWRYPESDSATLRDALSEMLNVPTSRIITGNGSESLIAAISRAFLGPDDVVVTTTPGFGLHEIEPLAQGARVIKVPMCEDLEFNVSALEDAIAASPRIVFISSPSNPVGTVLPLEGFRRLLACVGASTLFVFDEAYFEFVDKAYAFDSLAEAQAANVNFVSLRTFSKAYGLAGLRIGYGIASDARIADLMRAALTPFNVNGAAQEAAVASLLDDEWMKRVAAKIAADRDGLANRLKAAGFKVAASQGNFLFLDAGHGSSDVAAALLRRGVVVKPWRENGYEHFIRVSIGMPEENERFFNALIASCEDLSFAPV